MSPAQYLLHVNSRPTQVSDSSWEEWYVDEHIPDLYNAKSCVRDSFYVEIPFALNTRGESPRKYLALYQTDFEELLKSEEYQSIRKTSEIYQKAGSNSSLTQDNGDFDARYYKLWQEYDPKATGEGQSSTTAASLQYTANCLTALSPQILCVYMNPSDEEDFEKWYREEHLELLSKIPGYRRSLRYKIGPRTPLTQGETQPYLAIHEVDDVSAFTGKEAEAANSTPWTQKHIKESNPFIARAYKRISAAGY